MGSAESDESYSDEDSFSDSQISPEQIIPYLLDQKVTVGRLIGCGCDCRKVRCLLLNKKESFAIKIINLPCDVDRNQVKQQVTFFILY